MEDNQTKILVDLQDLTDFQYVDLQQGKDFLLSLWTGSDDSSEDFESEDEYDTFIESLENITEWAELDSILQGCAYTICANENELASLSD